MAAVGGPLRDSDLEMIVNGLLTDPLLRGSIITASNSLKKEGTLRDTVLALISSKFQAALNTYITADRAVSICDRVNPKPATAIVTRIVSPKLNPQKPPSPLLKPTAAASASAFASSHANSSAQKDSAAQKGPNSSAKKIGVDLEFDDLFNNDFS